VFALRGLGALLAASLLIAAAPVSIRGFDPLAGAREHVDEALYLDLPSAQGAQDAAEMLGTHPHYAGTPADHAFAVRTRDLLRDYGFDARIESFTAHIDTPRKLVLELYADYHLYRPRETVFIGPSGTKPTDFELREIGNSADPATLDPAVGLPFNSAAANGDMTGPLVYAAHGLRSDFATLKSAGVDVRGTIALVRYGAAFRGDLVRNAQEAGAIGVILYDDPADDGAGRGPTYPNGPWRPENAVQRGWLGDGIRIPVLPISAATARTLLRGLRGPSGPADWAGALDAPYPVAKGPAFARIAVTLNHETRTLWNTIGVLPGTQAGEQVVLGAHRDAWVAGVGDDGAGATTLLEVARGLGYLAKSGRHPARTIVIALWDGEEVGLLGSQAYVRAHERELHDGCVAYLNADDDISGPSFGARAVGALGASLIETTRTVDDPARDRVSVHERWSTQARGVAVRPPGGGSDHESFLYHFGTPVAEMGFYGPFGVYHSSYDTALYAEHQSDPYFVLHRANAQLYGVLAMRLANADVVPYDFGAYVPVLKTGIAELEARAHADGRTVDFTPLQHAIDAFRRTAARVDGAIAVGSGPGDARTLDAAQTVDGVAYGVSGYASVAYPRIAAAYATGSPSALDDAIAVSAGQLDRARNDLLPPVIPSN
jgi:N-acetylated-alpha-linked acidic dipeptidase